MLPDWLLRGRIRPLFDKRNTIQRQQLLKKVLPRIEGGALFLNAPAGFGKTALLADLRKRVLDQDGAVAWFTLDPTDDPSTVIQYLFFALRESGLELVAQTVPDVTMAVAVQMLFSAVERSGRHWLLVLDNVDAATVDVARDVLSPLLRFTPDRMTIALAAEGAVPIGLSEWERRGLLVRIDADDLILNRAEIKALAGRAATDHQVRAIERKSGGWPAVAHFMIAKRFGTDPEGLKSRDMIADFLRDRLLAPLSESDRDIFAHLSLLNRFSHTLVLDLIPELPGGEVLARLLDRRLICRVACDEGLDLAVHPAFLDISRDALETSRPDAAHAFRARAARAYLAAGKYVHATAMAVSVGDEALIGEIIEACNPLRLWFELGVGPLRRIIYLIPEAMIRRNIRIGYACMIYWSKIGRLKACGELFAQIEHRIQEKRLVDNLPQTLRIERLMCRSLLAIYQGTPLPMADVEALAALAPSVPHLEHLVRSAAGTTRCYVLQQESAFDDAQAAAREAIGHAEHLHSQYAAFFLHCDIAMISGIKGDPAAAWSAFQAGERACQLALRDDERLTLIRDAFRLELQHEIDPGDTSASARLRNICRRLPGLDGWPDVFAAAFRTYSEKLALSDDESAAMTLIDAGIDYADRQGVSSLAYILGHHRVLLLVLAGKPAEARQAHKRLATMQLLEPGFRPWRVYETMIEARGALAFHFDDPGAKPLLDVAIDGAVRHGNLRSELRFRSMRSGLGLSADDGDIIGQLRSRSGFERASIIVERLRVPRPRPVCDSPGTGEPASSAFFTSRERAVLAGVERGLSDKALALELGITAHGVRYHLKRIYAQLGVHNRQDAWQKARISGAAG